MGKAYANRKPVVDNDLFHTPESLTWELCKVEKFKNPVEPACGDMAIVNPLIKAGYNPLYSDIERGTDFLTAKLDLRKRDIVTNPPFCLWDDFVNRSKELGTRKTAMIGKGNYWGTYERDITGVLIGLKTIYWFNRYVDYRTPRRKDGLFHVGAMCTGWFVFERGFKGDSVNKRIDVQQYAKLGNYSEENYYILEHLGIDTTWTPDMDIDCGFVMDKLQSDFKFKYTQKQLDKSDTIGKILSATEKQMKASGKEFRTKITGQDRVFTR